MRYVEFANWRLSKVGLGTSQFANPGWGYGRTTRHMTWCGGPSP